MNESVDCSWSTRQLERQINPFYYQRLLASRDKKMVKAEAEQHNQPLKPVDVLKNPLPLLLIPNGQCFTGRSEKESAQRFLITHGLHMGKKLLPHCQNSW
ncbi:MAG: hypothetical protein V2I97_05300 [Desulfococcaceae bacterium]|jgi:predicted nuclease of restriction endonuclease-like (RecB) superfamily|nr:hypothetical protein [Desulfococcaceae bacterium]